jgi:WD40 repeat protein
MHAQFFYLDKFVLLCAGRCAYLYRYTLQLPGRDALLRHPPPSGSAKIVHCFSLPHTQKIVAMDALNAVLSPIIIAAGSDRSLSVLDAGQGKVLRTLHCAHGRAVHSVALPKPSPFAPLPPERLDVFATAATDNVVTLWDVR